MKSWYNSLTQIILFVFISTWYSGGMAAISVQVTPPSVQVGETFQFILTLEDPQLTGMPDLTPLQQDFTIVGTERKMSYTVVNGKAHSLNQWIILLTAKKPGVFAIPALQIGQLKSPISEVEVTEGTKTSTSKTPASEEEVMLRTKVSQKNPFINQQVHYTVKLYTRQRLMNIEYHPPEIEDALMIQLGNVRQYQAVENGSHYTVQEQEYVIFPQKSGELTITGPSFSALVYDYSMPRGVNLQADEIKLQVKPAPMQFKAPWLPAKQIYLSDQYDKNETNFLQGTTLERTITLQAVAVPAQLLPHIQLTSQKGFNVYPDKPEVQNIIRNQELIGETTLKVTYLLNQPGEVIIPELNVHWYNTNTNQEEVTTLPAKKLRVDAKGSTTVDEPPVNPVHSPITQSPAVHTSNPLIKDNHVARYGLIGWWLAFAFALVWLLTLILWWWVSSNRPHRLKQSALNDLHKACETNNPLKARKALLEWAALNWPETTFRNLDDIAKQIPYPEFEKQLQILSQVLYAHDNKTHWQGHELWRSVIDYCKKKSTKRKSKANDLPPMNPM